MRNRNHPAYHHVAQKLQRYLQLLTELEAPLHEDGFDHQAAHGWAKEKLDALTALEKPRSSSAIPVTGDFAATSAVLEAELFQRMGDTLKFLRARAPDHEALPPHLIYYHYWRDCFGEPLRPLTAADLAEPEEAPEPVIATAIYGVIYDRINTAQLAFVGMDDSTNKSLTPLLIFLSGLYYAIGYQQRQGKPPVHTFNDGLFEIAREALEAAVDFANDPKTLAAARAPDEMNVPESQRLLLMVTYHAAIAQNPAVYEWLHRWYYLRDLTSMLFAMGARSLNDPYARGLIVPWLEDAESMQNWLPEAAIPYLQDFLTND